MPAMQYPEIPPAALTGAEAVYYTVGGLTTATLCLKLEWWLCNTHTASVDVTMYAAPDAATGAVANTIVNKTMQAKSVLNGTTFLNLAEGGTVRAFASVNGVVAIRLAPAEF